MVKAVVFDMFETLVTLFEGRTYFSENIAEDLGVPTETFRPLWCATETFRTVGQYTLEEVLEKTTQVLGLYSEETVQQIMQKRRECLTDTFSAIPDSVMNLLRTLKERGIKVGIISNCFSDEYKMIRESAIYPLIDAVKLSYDQGICKPDPAIYYRLIAELDVEPEECLYVGDGGSNELFTAKEVGMKPLQALWFRDKWFEPHCPCPLYEEFSHVEKPEDVLNYVTE